MWGPSLHLSDMWANVVPLWRPRAARHPPQPPRTLEPPRPLLGWTSLARSGAELACSMLVELEEGEGEDE